MDGIFNPFYAHLTLVEQKRFGVLSAKLSAWIMHVEQQKKEEKPYYYKLDLTTEEHYELDGSARRGMESR